MTVEMTRREALDYMRACTAMMIAFRHEADHAKTLEAKERAIKSMRMWTDRHELIAGVVRVSDEEHS